MAEERFKEADPVSEGDMQAELFSPAVMVVSDCGDEWIYLNVKEARALRDWLNKVLP